MNNKFKTLIKKSMLCGLTLTICIGVHSCTNNKTPKYIDDAIAICYDDNIAYLVNNSNERFSLEYYDEIIEIFDDYIGVKKDGKYGFIDRTGKEVIPTTYDKVYPMKEEKAVVIKDGDYHIIDNKGNIVYTFSNGIISESYFSNNHLIVSQAGKYGYITYSNQKFELTDLIYDYATVFSGEYAVVGKKETEVIYEIDAEGNLTDKIEEIKELETIKYNFLKSSNQLLFAKFEFDFADVFYDGWARVGTKKTMYAPSVGNSTPNNEFEGIEYKYINEKGEYLYLDHYYEYSYNGDDTQMHDTNLVSVPYATNFNDGYAVIANYRYSKVVDTFFKEYRIVDTDGELQYTEAIYYATGYRYGYERHYEFQAKSPSMFWINKITKIGDVLTFKTGNTANSPSFQIRYFEISEKSSYGTKYDLYNISWNLYEQKTNEDGSIENITPQYMIDYNNEFFPTSTSNLMIETAIKLPYEMDEIHYSKYINPELPVNRIRILHSNHYGLVKYEVKEKYLATVDDNITDIVASFIIEPIYDKIIY